MSKPNVASDLVRIHKIITRGLEVAIERSRTFAQEGYPNASTREGFVKFVQALASVIHGHHVTEDDVAFPYFRDKLPEMPFDELTGEHGEMEPILDAIRAAVEGIAAQPGGGPALDELNQALVRMADLWRPHIQKEEAGFRPEAVGALLTVEDQIDLARQFAQHSQEHTGPDYLVVPFMLYNLVPEHRAILSQAMPPMVTQQLVPVVWKDKWEIMKPFLLD
jgi:hemerythrin-like domain-containing protein